MADISFNQTVAYRLKLARDLHGLTMDQAAKRLAPYLGGKPWSRAQWSAAERSITGQRTRQFHADELAAFSQAFELPIGWFFIPPAEATTVSARGADQGIAPDELLHKWVFADREQVSNAAQDIIAARTQFDFKEK
jgi:transcriptional regulator with XRE-family HTH domain